MQSNDLAILEDDRPTRVPYVGVGIIYEVVPSTTEALNGTLREKIILCNLQSQAACYRGWYSESRLCKRKTPAELGQQNIVEPYLERA